MLPKLRNGDTTPDNGIAPSTPPEISSISNAISADKPSARNIPYSFGARNPIRIPRHTRNPSSNSTVATPQNPHSSPIAGSTRSVWPAGNHFRIAPARSRAERAAGGKRPQRMRQLIAAVHVVVPGRQPHVDAIHHRRRFAQVISDRNAAHQQRDAEHRQSGSSARHREHREKQKSGDQRRAEILQQKEQDQRAPTAHITGSTCERRGTPIQQRGTSRFSRRSRSRSQLRVK